MGGWLFGVGADVFGWCDCWAGVLLHSAVLWVVAYITYYWWFAVLFIYCLCHYPVRYEYLVEETLYSLRR